MEKKALGASRWAAVIEIDTQKSRTTWDGKKISVIYILHREARFHVLTLQSVSRRIRAAETRLTHYGLPVSHDVRPFLPIAAQLTIKGLVMIMI